MHLTQSACELSLLLLSCPHFPHVHYLLGHYYCIWGEGGIATMVMVGLRSCLSEPPKLWTLKLPKNHHMPWSLVGAKTICVLLQKWMKWLQPFYTTLGLLVPMELSVVPSHISDSFIEHSSLGFCLQKHWDKTILDLAHERCSVSWDWLFSLHSLWCLVSGGVLGWVDWGISG